MMELYSTDHPSLKTANDILKWIFLILPNYCLGRGLMDIAYNSVFNEIAKQATQLGTAAFGGT